MSIDRAGVGRFLRISASAALFLFALAVPARAQTASTLTNDDVVKMVKAQLATDIILTAIGASDALFDVTPAGLITLKEAGVPDAIVKAMQERMRGRAPATGAAERTGSPPDAAAPAMTAADRVNLLGTFKTMFVDAGGATYFGDAQMKAALWKNKGFSALSISIVEDRSVADVVLDVDYTFAWDYPFTLKHQGTSVVLLSGKGSGPFSGPRGATSVADAVVKGLKPFRR